MLLDLLYHLKSVLRDADTNYFFSNENQFFLL